MAKADCSELAKAIFDLAMDVASDPDVKNIDEVVGEIQKSFPVIPADQIIDAIVDASAIERKQADEVKQKLARIRREARTHHGLREMNEQIENYLDEGIPPEPPTPRKIGPDSIEQLRQTSKNLRRWLTTADPNMQKSMKVRLDNLDAQIESGDINLDRIQEARLHDELIGLQEQIKKAQQTVRDMKVIKKLMDQINNLEKHLAEGTIPQKKPKQRRAYGAVAVLREIRDDLKRQVSRSEPAQKKQLEKSIADLEARIKAGDFAPRTKQAEVPESKELQKLIFERDRLRRDIKVATLSLKPKTMWHYIAEPFNAIRALKTSFDLSAVLRQGGVIGLAHPVRAARAVPDMIRALFSDEAAARINTDIINSPNAPLRARSKLYLAPIDGTERLSRMEEAYATHMIDMISKANIPVISKLFKGVEASERAYITFLNKLRADSFDTMAATLAKNGEPTLEEAKAISLFINEATGRGSIGIEQAAVGLNTAFFAPKYVASRFQLLVGHPLWRGPASSRKLIAEEYARYLAGLITVTVLGVLAGGEWEPDPRSSDFGKIKFGKTRLDIMSGISQSAVITSRVAMAAAKALKITDTDAFKSSVTGKTRPLKSGDVGRFLRSKLSPTLGIPLNVILGENLIGEEMTPTSALLDAPIPLAFSDIYEVMLDQGIPVATAMSMLSAFGMGLQTYGGNTKRKKKKRSKLFQD